MINLTWNIEMEERRCYECGYWYAHEKYHDAGCPRCIGRQWHGSQREMASLRRTIAALRGALKRRAVRP